MGKNWSILVTGGAGYVGSMLVPALLASGHRVTVLDLYIYGDDVLSACRGNPNLREIKGDLRDIGTVRAALTGCNAVIHLACISNDPSFELDPDLGRSINYDAFAPLVRESKRQGIERFVYASSSSVYGIKEGVEVSEELALEPLTDYSKFKAMCEDVLQAEREPGFTAVTLRPATVCGYAPRQRLDVIVNILTNHAVCNRRMKVFGGSQRRPNIHIGDMVQAYLHVLNMPDAAVDGEVFNVGYENHTLDDLAAMVRGVVGEDVTLEHVPTDDLRSYHVSSRRIREKLGFIPAHTIEDAVRDLCNAFRDGLLPNSMSDSRYYNIKRMQELELSHV